jgi:hypothetical protein
MPPLAVLLTQPDQTIDIGFDAQGYTHLWLIGFRGTGLAVGNPTIYFEIKEQATLNVYGNVRRGFPLYFTADGTGANISGKGIPISGSHRFNAARLLNFRLRYSDGTLPIFTKLELLFEGFDTFYQGEAQFSGLEATNRT